MLTKYLAASLLQLVHFWLDPQCEYNKTLATIVITGLALEQHNKDKDSRKF